MDRLTEKDRLLLSSALLAVLDVVGGAEGRLSGGRQKGFWFRIGVAADPQFSRPGDELVRTAAADLLARRAALAPLPARPAPERLLRETREWLDMRVARDQNPWDATVRTQVARYRHYLLTEAEVLGLRRRRFRQVHTPVTERAVDEFCAMLGIERNDRLRRLLRG